MRVTHFIAVTWYLAASCCLNPNWPRQPPCAKQDLFDRRIVHLGYGEDCSRDTVRLLRVQVYDETSGDILVDFVKGPMTYPFGVPTSEIRLGELPSGFIATHGYRDRELWPPDGTDMGLRFETPTEAFVLDLSMTSDYNGP
jgi:hypothetical protein